MNLILLEPHEVGPDGFAHLRGRRARHIRHVLRPSDGEHLRVGVLGGAIGSGEVLPLAPDEDPDDVRLRVQLTGLPPSPSPVTLLVALPRPKILRKVLQAIASMGIARAVLLGTYRVEKSYFASPLLAPEAMEAELRLGLEQGRDTRLPQVEVRRFFKPFVEDELDALAPGAARLLAHPGAPSNLAGLRRTGEAGALLALGPEGGFTPYESEQLQARGFAPFSLGPRILRVDVAVPYAVGQAELWLAAGRSPA